jgi:hypothetical protein
MMILSIYILSDARRLLYILFVSLKTGITFKITARFVIDHYRILIQ